jgi:hypothetical protein
MAELDEHIAYKIDEKVTWIDFNNLITNKELFNPFLLLNDGSDFYLFYFSF